MTQPEEKVESLRLDGPIYQRLDQSTASQREEDILHHILCIDRRTAPLAGGCMQRPPVRPTK
jgi:hypothetical protein